MYIVEIIKAAVGPLIVILTAWLAYVIIKGNVTERNSFGLVGVVAIISALASAYGLWAYNVHTLPPESSTKTFPPSPPPPSVPPEIKK